MSFDVYWDDPAKTTIRAEGQGKWTWDEFHAAIELIVDMVDSVSHKVHLVVIPGSHMPAGSGMPHFSRAASLMPDNFGLNVMVTDSTFIRLMVNTLAKLLSARTHKTKSMVMVATLEEARALIAQEQARRTT